jgi:thioredoxin 1
MKLYYQDLSKQFKFAQFIQVDIDELVDVSQWANINALPTFALYKDGYKIDEVIGASKEKLLQMLIRHS